MPYRPHHKYQPSDMPQRPMSDEEMFAHAEGKQVGSKPLSDADLFGPQGAQIDDRDWNEQAQGYILNGLDNALFGFGDEAVAAGGALMGQGSYEKNLKDVERKHQRYRDLEDDWSPGNIASGAAGFVASTPVFNELYKGAQGVLRLGRAGAAPATKLGRLAENALALGGTGAAAGEVAQMGHAQGGVGSRVASLGADFAGVPGATAEEALWNAGKRIATNAALGAGAGVVAPALTRAGQRMAQFLRTPGSKAARYLAEKFVESGKSIDDFAAEWETAAKSGKPIAPVDIAPQQVRDAGTASARMPGAGRDKAAEMLAKRQEGQGARVQEDFRKALGTDPGSYVKTSEQISAERSAQAKPHYEKAFADKTPVSSQKIIELTNRPSGKEALNRGLRMAQDEGISLDELVIRDAEGNITGYTTKALHYGKMALDDMIEAAKRQGNDMAASNLTKLKRDWLTEMDRINPDYATARQIYAGHSANKSALDAGRKATKLHPDQIEAELADLSEGEREFYRQGFSQQIIEDMENAPDKANVVSRIFGTQAKRDRLLRLLGPEKYNQLADRFGFETKMYETYSDVYSNPSTAQRLAAQEDLNIGIAGLSPEASAGLAKSMATGSVGHFLNAIGWNGFMNVMRGISSRARAEIVRMLFSTDPAEVRAGLQAIKEQVGKVQRFNAIQQGVGAAAAGNEQARAATGVGAVGAASATGLGGMTY